MQTIDEIRLANLERLIRRIGSIQKLADAVGRSHSQISQIRVGAKHSVTGKRRVMGDDLARELETALNLERGWMDNPPIQVFDDEKRAIAHRAMAHDSNDFVTLPRLDLEVAAGHGRYANALARVESVKVALDIASRIQRHAGAALASLALISVAGDSMEPTLSDGDLVVVDCSVLTIDRDGVYVFTHGQETFIKRIQRMPNSLRVCSDNKLYDRWDITAPNDLHVHGRAVWVWGGREI